MNDSKRGVGYAVFHRLVYAVNDSLAWSWNRIKELPGFRRLGHGIAVVFGIYRLDRYLTRRDAAENLLLAYELQKFPALADAGRRLENAARQALR